MEALAHTNAVCTLDTTSDVFTIDVEDWFHIMEVEGTPDLRAWDTLPSRLEKNLLTLLDMLDAQQVKSTCFCLGWVARQFPHLLREAAERGHEIASHGFGHQLVHGLTAEKFREDIRTAKCAIEDATGQAVLGYRAPGFSITPKTPWAFDEILEAGYLYDSSVFPAPHGHGGFRDASKHPYLIQTAFGQLIEFPVSVANTPLGPQCFFGGGYLRLVPMWLILAMVRKVRSEGRGVVWYIHPREIDPHHPRLRMSRKRQFKSYVNLHGTADKLKKILQSGSFMTFREAVSRLPKMETAG